MKFPTLYKRSSKGATQQWDIEAFANPDDTAVIKVVHGQVGGKLQTTSTQVRRGKNVGKANETTPLQQAISEAKAKHAKQKDKGYLETLDNGALTSNMSKRPMLAHSYEKHKDKVKFPCFVQPKLDGIRCLAHKGAGNVSLFSRMGKPFETVPHIQEQLNLIMRGGEVWDGELYIHGEKFQTIVSLVKRNQPGSERVEYHVYDTVDDFDFTTRHFEVYVRTQRSNPKNIIWVDSLCVDNHEQIKAYHDKFVKDGYEGAIVRHSECPYKEGYRSPNLLKVKEFLDQEFEITGVSEGVGKFEGMAIFQCVTSEGATFDCMPKGTEEIRRSYWTNRESLIGKLLTVRFFEWTTSEPPCPRFPVGLIVRSYE